jgi:hypothetical protein
MATATKTRRAKSPYIARPPKWLRERAEQERNPMLLYSEERWSQDIAGALKSFGWTAYHTHNSAHSAAGFPDWCAIRIRHGHCRLLFAELKRQDGRASAAQGEWLHGLSEIGNALRALLAFAFPPDAPIPTSYARVSVETYLWRPADWPRVLEVLQ